MNGWPFGVGTVLLEWIDAAPEVNDVAKVDIDVTMSSVEDGFVDMVGDDGVRVLCQVVVFIVGIIGLGTTGSIVEEAFGGPETTDVSAEVADGTSGIDIETF